MKPIGRHEQVRALKSEIGRLKRRMALACEAPSDTNMSAGDRIFAAVAVLTAALAPKRSGV